MTKALTTTSGAQAALDTVETDPRLLMAAKAIQLMAGTNDDGTPKITADMALAAAMYQAGTGQLLGRDFYVNERIGRMEGYRGVSRDAVDRGIGDVQIKYRSLTTEEADDHEIQAGDTAVVCEVYQLRAWRLAQQIGQRYEPVTGVGVVRKIEKYTAHEWKASSSGKRYKAVLPENQWKPLQLEGGMTWRKKAQNRAYKEALRHVPGGHASADEILEEAALRGMEEMPPEAARLTVEQAQAWVEQHAVDGETGEVIDAPVVVQPAQPANGANGAPPATPADLPFRPTVEGAVDWACKTAPQVWPTDARGVILTDVVKASFNKLRSQGLTGRPLMDAWIAKVNDKLATWERSQQETATDAADGTWEDVDAHGVQVKNAPSGTIYPRLISGGADGDEWEDAPFN